MFYDATTNDHGLRHNPMKALIGPRPIGWISALNAKGEVNLSPYSFFNAVGENPFIVAFSSTGMKDASTFAEESGDFVCNFVSWDLREEMNKSAAPLPRGESEVPYSGLTTAPSRYVRAPRVAEAPAALECRWLQTVRPTTIDGVPTESFIVLGQVVGVYIDDQFIIDGIVDTGAMRPIMRGGYHDYFFAGPETKFSMRRPSKA